MKKYSKLIVVLTIVLSVWSCGKKDKEIELNSEMKSQTALVRYTEVTEAINSSGASSGGGMFGARSSEVRSRKANRSAESCDPLYFDNTYNDDYVPSCLKITSSCINDNRGVEYVYDFGQGCNFYGVFYKGKINTLYYNFYDFDTDVERYKYIYSGFSYDEFTYSGEINQTSTFFMSASSATYSYTYNGFLKALRDTELFDFTTTKGSFRYKESDDLDFDANFSREVIGTSSKGYNFSLKTTNPLNYVSCDDDSDDIWFYYIYPIGEEVFTTTLNGKEESYRIVYGYDDNCKQFAIISPNGEVKKYTYDENVSLLRKKTRKKQ